MLLGILLCERRKAAFKGTTSLRHLGRGMTRIPAVILQHFIGLSDYERRLAIDKASRELGMTVEQIEAEIENFQNGGFNQNQPIAESPVEVPRKKSIFNRPKKQKEGGPEFVDDSHKYRFRYDPSVAGKARQDKATQAIACPHCKAALGIPEKRPIRVTCPACMTDSTFED
jgi:hypothetical protein